MTDKRAANGSPATWKPRRFNDATLPMLDELKRRGWTAKALAEKFGMHQKTVQEAMRRAGAYAGVPK